MKDERLNRREAIIRYGLPIAAGLLLPQRFVGRALAVAADMPASAGSGFHSPDAVYTTPLATEALFSSSSDGIAWAGMNMEPQIIRDPEQPFRPETPTNDPKTFSEPLKPRSIIQLAPTVIVTSRIALAEGDQEQIGFLHTNKTPGSPVSKVEIRRGRELWAVAMTDNDFTRKVRDDEQTQIGEFPVGTTEAYLSMLLGDSGKLFGAFNPNGVIEKVAEYPNPTAELGNESLLVGYTFGQSRESRFTGVSILVPSDK